LELVKPPATLADTRSAIPGAILKPLGEISIVSIGTTSINITVISGQKYNFPLQDLEPSEKGGTNMADVSLNDHQMLRVEGTNAQLAAKRLVDALSVLKSAALSAEEEEARFQQAARNCRASAIKSQLPEGARRFRVQANDAFRDKDFDAEADYYKQALDVAPCWPEGHYNRALVLSEVDDYPGAITEMKRYLLLAPDAPDASASQDKIYEWERKAK